MDRSQLIRVFPVDIWKRILSYSGHYLRVVWLVCRSFREWVGAPRSGSSGRLSALVFIADGHNDLFTWALSKWLSERPNLTSAGLQCFSMQRQRSADERRYLLDGLRHACCNGWLGTAAALVRVYKPILDRAYISDLVDCAISSKQYTMLLWLVGKMEHGGKVFPAGIGYTLSQAQTLALRSDLIQSDNLHVWKNIRSAMYDIKNDSQFIDVAVARHAYAMYTHFVMDNQSSYVPDRVGKALSDLLKRPLEFQRGWIGWASTNGYYAHEIILSMVKGRQRQFHHLIFDERVRWTVPLEGRQEIFATGAIEAVDSVGLNVAITKGYITIEQLKAVAKTILAREEVAFDTQALCLDILNLHGQSSSGDIGGNQGPV